MGVWLVGEVRPKWLQTNITVGCNRAVRVGRCKVLGMPASAIIIVGDLINPQVIPGSPGSQLSGVSLGAVLQCMATIGRLICTGWYIRNRQVAVLSRLH